MSAVQVIENVPTADTGEAVVVPVLVDYHLNTGWEWMDAVTNRGWTVLGMWGEDGYDLGQWPYIVVAIQAVRDDKGPLYGFALYCEGDVSTRWYRGLDAYFEAITEQAFFYWQLGQADGPKNLPATAAKLAPEYRRPFGWQSEQEEAMGNGHE